MPFFFAEKNYSVEETGEDIYNLTTLFFKVLTGYMLNSMYKYVLFVIILRIFKKAGVIAFSLHRNLSSCKFLLM